MRVALRRTAKAIMIGCIVEAALYALHLGLSHELRDTPIAAAMLTAPGSAAAVMGAALVIVRILLYLFVPMLTAFFAIVALVRYHEE